MNMLRFGILFLLCMSASYASFSQTGTLRGFVYEKETGEPVLFTPVVLEGTTIGTTTDYNGFFSLPKIPEGSYTLLISSLEFDSLRVPITITAGQVLSQSLYLEKRLIKLKEVDISASRENATTQTQVSTIAVTPKEVSLIPSVGGEPDITQFLQIIPGVIFTGDQGGQIYIRGGAPIQTKVLLDGATIYNPFHSIGLYSVFETDLIKSADVYTGGFNAEYGDRISAIIDIKTRDGNKNRLSGKVAASPFLASATLEGPLMKPKERNSSLTFLLNSKISYLNRTSPTLYSYANKDGLPFSFYDYYGKLTLSTNSGSKLNLFGFHHKDDARFRSSDFEWNTLGFGSNFVVVPGQAKVLISGNLSYTGYNINLREGDNLPRTSSVNSFTLGMQFTYFLKNGEFKYGFDVNGFKTIYEFYNALGLLVDQNQNTTEIGFFVRYRKVLGKLVLEPSFRAQYYATLATIWPEPRLSIKFAAHERLRLKLAGGLYSQNLISGKSDRDVVNLFTSFLSGPEVTLYNARGESAKNNLQLAYHAVFGVEYEPARFMKINIEPYYKYYGRLIDINRNKLYDDVAANSNVPNELKSDFLTETGRAYGLDLLLKLDYKNFYFWGAYSLAYVEHHDGITSYPPHYDRRHNLNLVGAWRLEKKVKWEFSARWNLGTGFPFTRTQAFYLDLGNIFYQNGILTNYVTANPQNAEDIGIVYEEQINAGRLPGYHRLDLSAKCSIPFSKRVAMDITASVINVYNRANIFYYDRIRAERVNQLPVLPALSLSLSF
ncbi:MAG: TonB-dependent receptor [Chitinophagales bacterium]|nr:MAG: TonB-dependent receptor [Chitinophagales bacterium]